MSRQPINPQATSRADPDPGPHSESGRELPRLLLVEAGSPAVNAALQTMLEADFSVLRARDAVEALATGRREAPDLILCPLRQPGSCREAPAGAAEDDAELALLRAIRADPLLGRVVFFFFTDQEPPDEAEATRRRLACLDAGVDDILPLGRLGKPEFLARLHSRLRLTRRRIGDANAQAGLHEVLESIDDMFYTVDAGFRFTYLNRKIEERWGRSRTELLGRHFWTEFPVLLGSETHELHLRAMADRQPVHYETISPLRGRPIAMNIYPSQGGGLAVYFRDISGLKETEKALREREERLRLIVESARDFVIFTMDTAGLVTSWNPGAEAILGWPEAEIIGQPGALIFTPEDRAALQPEAEITTARRDGRAEDERWHLRRDGTRFWGSGVLMVMVSDGREVGFLKIMRDLTAMRVAEKARHQAEERFGLLVESVKDYAIFLLDADGCITTWNQGAERIKGYTEAEAIGQPAAMLYPPEAVAEGLPERELETARIEGRTETQNWRLRKNGERFWAEELIISLRDTADGGELLGFATICRDLTTQKAADDERARLLAAERLARAEAESANAAKDQFLAVLSHELRTPLTPVQMALYALRHEKRLTVAGRDMLDLIARNLAVETQLIDDLLDVSRIVHGKLEPSLEPLDLHACLHEALEVCHQDCAGKNLQVVVELEATNDGVTGDSGRLQQVFWNLLKNAAKFTPAGGRVTIRSHNPAPDRIAIEIADNGIGIEPESLTKIFDPFEQGGAAVARRYGGLGLGLAISHAIVQAHGGTLTATSAGRGQGAVFTVELPLRGSGGQNLTAK